MEPGRWKQIKGVLAEVLAAPEGERAGLVERLCGGDVELSREVEEIWRADGAGGQTRSRIETVAAGLAREGVLEEGEWLGPFRVVREIGRGGMGVVYLAEREEPFRQRVAIKVISPKHLGREFAAAFGRERQILASLEHPLIARVLHGGETEGGIPYLVMEYVEGRRLENLGGDRELTERVIAVCGAVAYAQERMVVHGDLKPENILVTAEGGVKLLDFGVAGMAEASAFYSDGYASPEQRRGERLTAASDVYALGRILTKLLRRVDGEMAAILGKACAEEAEKRYGTAKELGEELQRWREGRAVRAYSMGGAYRAWAWARRNPVAAVAAVLAVLSLTVGIVISQREARVAERRYQEMFQLSMAVLGDFYEPARAPDFPAPARQWMVRKALERLAALTGENPRDTKVREALADGYLKIGDLLGNPGHANVGDAAGAERAYGEAIAILTPMGTEGARAQLVRLKMRRADLKTQTGEAGEAARLYDEAAAEWRRLPGPGDAETGRVLAVAVMKAAQGNILENKLEAARPRLNEAIAMIRPLAKAAPGNTRMQRTLISALSRLAFLERQLDRKAEARGLLEECAEVGERGIALLPEDSDLRQNTAFVYGQLGLIAEDMKEMAAAGKAYRRGLALSDAELKRDPKNAQVRATWAMVATNLAMLLWTEGTREEAVGYLRGAVRVRSEAAGAAGAAQMARVEAGRVRMTLGLRLQQMGKQEEAMREGRAAARELDGVRERGDFRVNREHGVALRDYGVILWADGKREEARGVWGRAVEMLRPIGETQPRVREVVAELERLRAEGR